MGGWRCSSVCVQCSSKSREHARSLLVRDVAWKQQISTTHLVPYYLHQPLVSRPFEGGIVREWWSGVAVGGPDRCFYIVVLVLMSLGEVISAP